MSFTIPFAHQYLHEGKRLPFDYIEPFYDRKRRHSTLRYASPAMLFWKTGSALSMSSNWRHNANALDDEKQREA